MAQGTAIVIRISGQSEFLPALTAMTSLPDVRGHPETAGPVDSSA